MQGGQGRSRAVGMVLTSIVIGLGAGCTGKYTDKIAEQDRTIQRLREENSQYEQSLATFRNNEEILNRTIESERQRNAQMADALESAKQKTAPAGRGAAAKSTDPESDGALEEQRTRLAADLAGAGVSVEVRSGNLVVTLPSAGTFSSGSATLSSQGQETLKKVGRVLKDRFGSRTVSIEGHTDNEPVKKSKFGTNWRLSVERALAVQQFLEDGCKIAPNKLRVVGYGPYRPLGPNDKETAKQKNRRVELVIQKA